MKTSELLTLLLSAVGSIATFIVALTTCRTVSEMKKSREASIHPELIVLAPIYKYDFRWIHLEDLSPIIRPELHSDEKNKYDSRLPVFRLKNIGNSAAKNIRITWSIEGESLEEAVSKNQILQTYHLEFLSGTYKMSRSQNEILTNNEHSHFENEETSLDYCVASPQNDFVDELKMPEKISANYVLRLAASERSENITVISAPNINIKLQYYGVDGREHERNFVITSNYWYLPDSVSSDTNTISKEFINPDNTRGFITFKIQSVVGEP